MTVFYEDSACSNVSSSTAMANLCVSWYDSKSAGLTRSDFFVLLNFRQAAIARNVNDRVRNDACCRRNWKT